LSGGGGEMTVETELQMQHGYESNGRGPAGYGTAKDVYVKESREPSATSRPMKK
jgi:hypothetical protein